MSLTRRPSLVMGTHFLFSSLPPRAPWPPLCYCLDHDCLSPKDAGLSGRGRVGGRPQNGRRGGGGGREALWSEGAGRSGSRGGRGEPRRGRRRLHRLGRRGGGWTSPDAGRDGGAASPEQQEQEGSPAAAADAASEELRPGGAAAAAAPAETASSRVLRGGRDRGRTAVAAAVVSRRKKAEYPGRRRSSPSNRPPDGPGHQPVAAKPPSPAQGKKSPRLQCIEKITTDKDPKEEKEDASVLPQEVSITTSRPSRSWRSSSRTSISHLRDTENTRSSRSKTGSLQLVYKTEPITDQLDYDVPEEHQSPGGISSDEEEEEEEEMLISEEEIPFKDDPRDETYKPHLERETPKPRRKSGKVKEEKEKKEIKVEVEVEVKEEENEIREDEEPPRKRGRRRKDDKSPRLPKRRKKPPIQYVRCEMEGCGTVLAHPRYLQHHIKYQHLLKKKNVCPHPSCGRLFRLQKQLLRHAKHHTDQRDYICEYCARAFKSSHNLAVHRMIHTGEKPLQCEICGFTCRQKASLNWHMKKHDADSFYQFSCNICGKKFEKKDSVVAHKAKSHPEVLIAEALAANAGALITSTDILGTNPEHLTQPADGQGLPLLPEPLGNSTSGECLLLEAEGMSKSYCSGTEQVSLMADGKIFVGSGSSGDTEGLVMNSDILGATTEVLIEDTDSTGP